MPLIFPPRSGLGFVMRLVGPPWPGVHLVDAPRNRYVPAVRPRVGERREHEACSGNGGSSMVQCGPAFIVIYLLMPALVLLHTALTSFSNLLRDSPSTSFIPAILPPDCLFQGPPATSMLSFNQGDLIY